MRERSLPKYQIMILVPYESFKIKTSLPLDDVLLKIANHVETKKTYWTLDISKSFQGIIRKDGFRLHRRTIFRISPCVIYGKFVQISTGTVITAKMSYHPLIIAFMCLFLSLILFGFIDATMNPVAGPNVILALLILSILSWFCIFMGGFWFEAKKSKSLLNDMFA